MKIAISAETTCDLTKDLLNEHDIKIIPFEIVLGDKMIKDGEISPEEIFAFVDKNGVLPKTTALNEYEYTEFFEEIKKDYDAIIHIALSSGISSSCGNAERASKNVENVYVVDSQTLTTGIGLLALYARDLANQGLAPSEIQKKVQERTASVQASFVVERLDYLYKGGRCNALQFFGANLLKIRPRIVVKNGKMGTDKKYRGNMVNVIEKYSQEVFADFNTPNLDKAFITYSSASDEMIEKAENACKEMGFKKIYKTTAGCTISSHCGANTLGIIYFNDGENK
ncbi:MAG: DegV family protein [Clostridia bacterium]|nr:DegV family protein [Clostridia bacterium]